MISAYLCSIEAAVNAAQCSILASMTPEELEAYNKQHEFVGPVKPDSFMERNGLMMFMLAEMSIYALAITGMIATILFLISI